MSHEEFLETSVTQEVLDDYWADLLLCEELEGKEENEEEEEEEE